MTLVTSRALKWTYLMFVFLKNMGIFTVTLSLEIFLTPTQEWSRAHSFIFSPYLIMNYKIFMCQESQSFKIYDIIWCWKHAADIETYHYIKDFTCIFVNSPPSQNTNLFKVELWPGFTWMKKKITTYPTDD